MRKTKKPLAFARETIRRLEQVPDTALENVQGAGTELNCNKPTACSTPSGCIPKP